MSDLVKIKKLVKKKGTMTGQRSNQPNYVPSLFFMGLVGNPHVYCLFLLSVVRLCVSTLSTEYTRLWVKLACTDVRELE